MRKCWYRRQNGKSLCIECDAAFWNGMAMVFVKGGENASAVAVISPLPGEMIFEDSAIKEWDVASLEASNSQSPS
jgi:hypothetical protein